MKFNLNTHDYLSNAINSPPVVDVIEAAFLRLSTVKGSYFTDPDFGSELYRLKRNKDLPQVRLQAIAWAKQALEPLKSRYYLSDITVTEQLPATQGKIALLITLTHQSGQQYQTTFNVQVAG